MTDQSRFYQDPLTTKIIDLSQVTWVEGICCKETSHNSLWRRLLKRTKYTHSIYYTINTKTHIHMIGREISYHRPILEETRTLQQQKVTASLEKLYEALKKWGLQNLSGYRKY
jgi:hypothetical protein